MPIGQATQDTVYAKPPAQTLADVRKALDAIGRTVSVDGAAGTLQGVTRYGLQQVQIKVSIVPDGAGSKIAVVGLSDDVWAAGAKNGLKRLLESLENLDNPNHVPSPSGMGALRLALTMIAFVAVLVVVLVSLLFAPPWVTGVVLALGFGVLIYFLVAKAAFGKK